MDIKKWFADFSTKKKHGFYLYKDFPPDSITTDDGDEKAPIYLQLHGIGIALYDDGTYLIEDTSGG